MAKSKASVSRSSEAYQRLHQDLIDGKLAPDTKLVIAELQDRYEIGAMPLREALNRLSAERFVLKHDQRGFSVPPLDADLFLEIQNARLVVEVAALRETIHEHRPAWEDRLVLAYHRLAKASAQDGNFLLTDAWSQSHALFHKELISGCDNSWIQSFARSLYTQSERYRVRRREIDSGGLYKRVDLLGEHKRIMDSAIGGDSDAATGSLVEHYRRSVETVIGAPVDLTPTQMRFQRRAAP